NNQQPTTNNKIYFEIEDTGAGIAKEECDRLFEPFVQTRTGRSSSEGTGLGLPISREFVRLMGGDISLKSEVNKGSVFTFYISVNLSDREPKIREEQPQIKGLALGQNCYRILIVEDVAENRQLLQQILRSIGFDTREATDGQEAIDLWKSWQPDLIFMDIQMPNIDGYEATQLIREQEGEKERRGDEEEEIFPTPYLKNPIPIIALTARAFTEDREAILSAGCNDFISKPFRQEDLFEVLGKHLNISYVYDETSESIENQETDELTYRSIAVENLSIMPETWRDRFYHAGLQCSDSLVNELIEQIPLEHSQIKIPLKNLVDNFRFDIISELARESLEKP
ncbi:MAG: response regulator, partial [Spirulina sp.]